MCDKYDKYMIKGYNCDKGLVELEIFKFGEKKVKGRYDNF